MENKPFQITLFFTYGVSLKKWAESGLLQREIQLYRELQKQYNVHIQLITFGDSSDREWESKIDGIELLPVYERLPKLKSKILSFFQSVFVPWFFRFELRKSNLFKTNQLWGGWVAVLSKWFFQKPLLVRCGYEFYNFEKEKERSRISLFLFYLISKWIYSSANHIHISTFFDKKFIKNTFNIDDSLIEIRPNWIDTDIYKPISMKLKNRILFVGRLSEQKNLNLLFSAINNNNIGIDIVGDGELRNSLDEIIQKSSIDINFLGRLPNDQMPKVYNSYPIYIICSEYEGNPKTLLEAMSCGMAVIGTNVQGIREIIVNGENGLLVTNNEPSLLMDAIKSLLIDKALQKKLGDNARTTILKSNSMKNAIVKEYNTYRKLIN